MRQRCIALLFWFSLSAAQAQSPESVVDVPTRPGVVQRVLLLSVPAPAATVLLFAGGEGGLRLRPDGRIAGASMNFLVRSRQLFAQRGLQVVVLDAPSDRQHPPYLRGFRQTPEHAADVQAVIAWARAQAAAPVWLVGTSRGTQSVAYVASQLVGQHSATGEPAGPDGLVLSSSILVDEDEPPVPAMPWDKLQLPVLVVHHRNDRCRVTPFSDLPRLMDRLASQPRHALLAFEGGVSQGNPCQALAHHGYNGIEAEVVTKLVDWLLAVPRTRPAPVAH